MARPTKDDKKTKIIPIRATEGEKTALQSIATNRGLYLSEMIMLDYLQKQPKVTFANPDRARLIKAIALLGQIVTYLNTINPKDASQSEQIDSAIQGALLSFTLIKDELNGNKG